MQKETQKIWDQNLSKIIIKSDSKDKLTQFYTHLYHSMIHPNIVSDINGEYMGADFIKKRVEKGRIITAHLVFGILIERRGN